MKSSRSFLDLVGPATKGVSDAGRVSILADVPASREPDFRNAIASIGGENPKSDLTQR